MYDAPIDTRLRSTQLTGEPRRRWIKSWLWLTPLCLAQTGDPVFPFFQDLFGTRLLRSMDSVTGIVRGPFFNLPFKPTAKL